MSETDGIKLAEFKYSQIYDQNYVLEFGHQYIGFFTQGGRIVDGYGAPYVVAPTPYEWQYLPYLRFAQNLDELITACPFVPPQRLIRYDDLDWELIAVPLDAGPWGDENNDPLETCTANAAGLGPATLTFTDDVFLENSYVGSYIRVRGDKKYTKSIAVENTFTDALKYMIGEKGVISLNGTWVATAMLQKSYDQGTTWVDYLSFTTNTTREFEEVEDNIYYRIGIPTTKYTSGTMEASISRRDVVGKALITGPINSTSCYAQIREEFPNITANYKYSFSAFNAIDGYPQAVAFFEGRLLFGGTVKQPQTIWASAVDDYFNFDTGGVLDSDPYSYTLYSGDINTIQWMIGADLLRIGTTGGEWKFGKRDEPTTPTNVDTKQQTNNGCAGIQAIMIGGSVMFAQAGGTKLRSMTYDYASDKYVSPEISVIAEHLCRKGIKEMKFSNNPDPIMWIVSNEGTLIGCTYNVDQQIVAFHEHETQGTILSVAVIPGTDRDEVWIAVDRGSIGEGQSGIYIEQMTTPFWENVEDAIYLDSAITASDEDGMTRVVGLTHLAGKTVKVITDGSVHPDCVVNWGTGGYGVDLNWPAYKVHVGLGYTSTMMTMPIEPGVEGGSSAGHKKKGFRVSMGLYRTNHVSVGTENTLDIVPFRSSAMNMNEAIPIFTGTKKIWLDKGATDEFKLRAQSDVPLPFALTFISPIVYSSGA